MKLKKKKITTKNSRIWHVCTLIKKKKNMYVHYEIHQKTDVLLILHNVDLSFHQTWQL